MAKGRRLATQENCRQAIAWIFRRVENDEMDSAKARVLIYAALSISGILAEHDLETRVVALEQKARLRRTA